MAFNLLPYGYAELNLAEGLYTPSEIHNADDYVYWYWYRSLIQRASSVIEFENLPENWTAETIDFFYFCLLTFGKVAVFNNAKFGLSFQPCNLYGFDFYYQPTDALVTNPALTQNLELKIHKDCELIKLSPDYNGIVDILNFYAEKLAHMSASLDMTIENSKTAFVLFGKTKSAIASLKKIVDYISQGRTTIVADGRVVNSREDVEPFGWLTRNAKDSYVGTDLLQDIQTTLNMFDREIGIPTVPYQKKERMVEYESKSAMVDSSSRLATWLKTLEDSVEAVNKMFNLNITVDARIDIEDFEIPESEGGLNNE